MIGIEAVVNKIHQLTRLGSRTPKWLHFQHLGNFDADVNYGADYYRRQS